MSLDLDKRKKRKKEKISVNIARYWLGKKRNPETIEKIRKALLGKRLPPEVIKKLKGRIPWNKGKRGYRIHTEEQKKKFSEFHTGKKWRLGYKLSIEQKERLSRKMRNLWKERKIKPNSPWNKGINTKVLGKSRPIKEKQIYICQSCGKEFVSWKVLKRKFCSRKCKNQFQKENPERYTHLSKPEIREKISKAKKGIRTVWGEKHGNWQGGKSFEPYSIDWTETLKRAIRDRDHYICQLCNQYGITVHHISYDKKDCNPNNLIILCRSCNSKVNKYRDFWTNHFRQRLLK